MGPTVNISESEKGRPAVLEWKNVDETAMQRRSKSWKKVHKLDQDEIPK